MYLCYVDDSGDSAGGVTLTGLLIAEDQWTAVLGRWLAARREIHSEFGVAKHTELHANRLMAGRGYRNAERISARRARGSVYRIMVKSIPGTGVELLTVGTSSCVTHQGYGLFVEELQKWAEAREEYVLVFYDGRELGVDGEDQDVVLRNNSHYREVHRDQALVSRRVIEDVITQDSRFSQLLQAVDLIAYGVWHTDVSRNPARWKVTSASKAHQLTINEFAKIAHELGVPDEIIWYS